MMPTADRQALPSMPDGVTRHTRQGANGCLEWAGTQDKGGYGRRRNLPDLAARLAVLEADAPLAGRDRMRRLRQRLGQLERTRAQSWMREWAQEWDNVAFALARLEVGRNA